jgi:hypothetical protein
MLGQKGVGSTGFPMGAECTTNGNVCSMPRRNADARTEAMLEAAVRLLPDLRIAPGKPAWSVKCVVVPASLAGRPVVVKAVFGSSSLWRFYLDHERAVYELFARVGPPPIEPVRVPRLLAAVPGELVVLERMPGEPVARTRHSSREVAPDTRDAVWETLLVARASLRTWAPRLDSTTARSKAASHVARMRRRLLEDPFAEGSWIARGVERLRTLGMLAEADARRMLGALEEHPATCFSHGDLLLRNVLVDAAGSMSIVDWECAGEHLEAWDAALLWVFAPAWARRRLEAEHAVPAARQRAFLSCVAFALTREAFHRARRRSPGDPVLKRLLYERDVVLGALRTCDGLG